MRGDFISGNKSGTATVERRFVNAIRYVTLCCVCVCVRACTSAIAIARVSTSMRSACVVNRDSMCSLQRHHCICVARVPVPAAIPDGNIIVNTCQQLPFTLTLFLPPFLAPRSLYPISYTYTICVFTYICMYVCLCQSNRRLRVP